MRRATRSGSAHVCNSFHVEMPRRQRCLCPSQAVRARTFLSVMARTRCGRIADGCVARLFLDLSCVRVSLLTGIQRCPWHSVFLLQTDKRCSGRENVLSTFAREHESVTITDDRTFTQPAPSADKNYRQMRPQQEAYSRGNPALRRNAQDACAAVDPGKRAFTAHRHTLEHHLAVHRLSGPSRFCTHEEPPARCAVVAPCVSQSEAQGKLRHGY